MQRSENNNGELNNLLKQFWSLEATGITPQVGRPLSFESVRFDGERYEVAVPWKHERPELLTNRQMAEKRLRTVEKKLMQEDAYQLVVKDYLSPRGRAETAIRMVPSTFLCGTTKESHNQSSGCFRRLDSPKWKKFEQ